MSISQGPEIECPKCKGRMYLDCWTEERKETWVCMECNHKIPSIREVNEKK